MTHDEFTLWIKGYIQLSTEDNITRKQGVIIQNHAALVKAVEGYLSKELTSFLFGLKQCFLDTDTLPFEEFKKIWGSSCSALK